MIESETSEEKVFGLDVVGDENDRRLIRIKTEWVEIEGALYTGKWFDYRQLNSVQATYLFAHEMVKAFRAAYRKVDHARAPYVKPFKGEDIFELPRSQLMAIWRARQVADAMGMPYPVYLECAYRWTLRYWTHRYLPRPNNLYTDLVTDRAALDWQEMQGARLYFSSQEIYSNDAYAEACEELGTGLAMQNDHHEWLFSQADKRHDKTPILAQFLYGDRILPESKILARYGDEELARIRAHSNSFPKSARYN